MYVMLLPFGQLGSHEPKDIFLLIRLGVWGGTQPPLLLGPESDLFVRWPQVQHAIGQIDPACFLEIRPGVWYHVYVCQAVALNQAVRTRIPGFHAMCGDRFSWFRSVPI